MNTTKFWRVLMMVFIVTIVALTLTSCGDDDKDEPVPDNSPLLGSWKEVDNDDCYLFNADGTGLLFFIPACDEDNEWFKYKFADNVLMINWADGDANVYTVNFVSSSRMLLTDEFGYTETYVKLPS